jgi:hypothetical protein
MTEALIFMVLWLLLSLPVAMLVGLTLRRSAAERRAPGVSGPAEPRHSVREAVPALVPAGTGPRDGESTSPRYAPTADAGPQPARRPSAR